MVPPVGTRGRWECDNIKHMPRRERESGGWEAGWGRWEVERTREGGQRYGGLTDPCHGSKDASCGTQKNRGGARSGQKQGRMTRGIKVSKGSRPAVTGAWARGIGGRRVWERDPKGPLHPFFNFSGALVLLVATMKLAILLGLHEVPFKG